MTSERWTETQAIRHDSDTLGQGHPLPVSGVGKDYKEYRYHPKRVLRVRILHPDPAEWKSGVDLIYESYWEKPLPNKLQVTVTRSYSQFDRIMILQLAHLGTHRAT